MLVFNKPPTAKVIRRRGHGLKAHPTDWWSWELNLGPLVYKARGLSTTPQRLHVDKAWWTSNDHISWPWAFGSGELKTLFPYNIFYYYFSDYTCISMWNIVGFLDSLSFALILLLKEHLFEVRQFPSSILGGVKQSKLLTDNRHWIIDILQSITNYVIFPIISMKMGSVSLLIGNHNTNKSLSKHQTNCGIYSLIKCYDITVNSVIYSCISK